MNPFSIEKLPSDVMQELALRHRTLRKRAHLSQQEMAERSGVSLGSIKRFERTGQIALEALLKLSLILDRLKDFDAVFQPGEDLEVIERLFTKPAGK